MELLGSREYRALSGRELMRELHVSRGDQQDFRRLLRDLLESGQVRKLKGSRYRLATEKKHVAGKLLMHRDGYGFVQLDDPASPDVYVRRRNLGGALHGDRVQVQVTAQKGGGRAEGRIGKVLERSLHRFTGVLQSRGKDLVAVPYGSEPYEEVRLKGKGDAQDGMVVGVEVLRRERDEIHPEGRIVEVMGLPDEPGMDLQVIIRKYGLRDEFPAEVVQAAKAAPSEVSPGDLEGRDDFRQLATVTIDGETARDFDDAVTIRKHEDGGFTLWVHIADVSHYVQEDSPLDLEARERATSVYFPERAIHMLPSELSTGICSLNPGVDRLCQTCCMEIDASGNVKDAHISKGVIRSDRRMTYKAVAACLDGDAEARREYGDHVGDFDIMKELSLLLQARRDQRGSLDFDLPQPVILLDDDGEMTGVKPSERNIAHRIIEEFMLAANEAVARFLVDREWPALYRIHEKPDPAKVADLDAMLKPFGFSVPKPFEDITPKALQGILKSLEGKREAAALQRIVLRSLMRAVYSEVFGLHFGLATRRYLHFTSPIRRYPDLIVHRTLSRQSFWEKSTAEQRDDRRARLHDFAEHSSERERNAEAAEWELIDWKKANFMLGRVGEEFDAIISGVVSFGLFVELEDLFIDGLVHISTLTDDYYRFVENKHLLVGERTGKRFKMGDEVRVLVDKVNGLTKRIDFRLVGKKRADGA